MPSRIRTVTIANVHNSNNINNYIQLVRLLFIAIVSCLLCIGFYYHSVQFLDNTEKSHSHHTQWRAEKKIRNIVIWCLLSLIERYFSGTNERIQIHTTIAFEEPSFKYYKCISRIHTWHHFFLSVTKNTKENKHSTTAIVYI